MMALSTDYRSAVARYAPCLVGIRWHERPALDEVQGRSLRALVLAAGFCATLVPGRNDAFGQPKTPWLDTPPVSVRRVWGIETTSSEDLRVADDATIEYIMANEAFNAEPFHLDDRLKAAISASPKLQWLRLSRRLSNAELRWLSTLVRLRGVEINSADLSDADMAWLKDLKDLMFLDLFWCKLPAGERGVFPCLPALKILAVGNNEGGVHESAIANVRGLEVLLLHHGRVSDKGVAQIVEGNPGLLHLGLVFVEGFTPKSIAELGRLKKLVLLDIQKTSLDRDDHVRELQRLLPDCLILKTFSQR